MDGRGPPPLGGGGYEPGGGGGAMYGPGADCEVRWGKDAGFEGTYEASDPCLERGT